MFEFCICPGSRTWAALGPIAWALFFHSCDLTLFAQVTIGTIFCIVIAMAPLWLVRRIATATIRWFQSCTAVLDGLSLYTALHLIALQRNIGLGPTCGLHSMTMETTLSTSSTTRCLEMLGSSGHGEFAFFSRRLMKKGLSDGGDDQGDCFLSHLWCAHT